MRKPMGIAAAVALSASVLLAATPADARYYGRHYHRHGASTGTVLGVGILGLAAGAALASSARDRYYDGPPPPPVYAPPPPPPPSYSYEERCRVDNRWDPYAGRYLQYRSCY